MSREARLMWGVMIVTIPTVVLGGLAVLGFLTGGAHGLPPTPQLSQPQLAYYRAGHAHAGVLLILGLLLQLALDHARLPGRWIWPLRVGAALPPLLVPGGFFGPAHAPALALLWYVGAAVLAVVTLVVGIGLIRSFRSP